MTEQEVGIAIFIAIVVFWGVGMLAVIGCVLWFMRPHRDPKPRKKSRRTSPARRTSTRRPTA